MNKHLKFLLLSIGIFTFATSAVAHASDMQASSVSTTQSLPRTKYVRTVRYFKSLPLTNPLGDIVDYNLSTIPNSIWYDDGQYRGYLYFKDSTYELHKNYYKVTFKGFVRLGNFAPLSVKSEVHND